MSLKAASHTFIVEPSFVDDNEHQTRSGLFIAGDAAPRMQTYRGVITDIGHHIDEPHAEVGGVILYSGFIEVGVGDHELHIVGHQFALAFEAA